MYYSIQTLEFSAVIIHYSTLITVLAYIFIQNQLFFKPASLTDSTESWWLPSPGFHDRNGQEFKTKRVAEGKLPYSLTTPDEAMEHWKAQVSCPALESYSTGSSSYPTPSWAIHAPASCLSLLLLFQSMMSFFHTLSKAWCKLSLP